MVEAEVVMMEEVMGMLVGDFLERHEQMSAHPVGRNQGGSVSGEYGSRGCGGHIGSDGGACDGGNSYGVLGVVVMEMIMVNMLKV